MAVDRLASVSQIQVSEDRGLVLEGNRSEEGLAVGSRLVVGLPEGMVVLQDQVRTLGVDTALDQEEEGLFVDSEVGTGLQAAADRVVEDILDREDLGLVVEDLVAEGTVLEDLLGLTVAHQDLAVVEVVVLYRHFLAS